MKFSGNLVKNGAGRQVIFLTFLSLPEGAHRIF